MNIRRGLYTAMVGAMFIVFVRSVIAFDTYVAHPELTRAMAESFGTLKDEEIEWIVQGSLEEDEPASRVLNHFYDPIRKQGLTVAGVHIGLPSPEWAHAPLWQRLQPGAGDCSWQIATGSYKRGEKAKAFRCLGHILHLLEDAGVPAHTRNDQHLEGDPFEQWAKYHGMPPVKPSSVFVPTCTTDQECIKELAYWINNNFFSKDTIESSIFEKPFNEVVVKNGYAIARQRKLAVFNARSRLFSLTEEVHQAYWNEISPQVLVFGKKIIEIFFHEVGEKLEPSIVNKDLPSLPRFSSMPKLPISTIARPIDLTIDISDVEKKNESVVTEPLATSNYPNISVPVPIAKENQQLIIEPTAIAPALINTALPLFFGGSGYDPLLSQNLVIPDTYITQRPPSVTNEIAAHFVFASDTVPTSFECNVDGQGWNPCSSSYDIEGLIEGRHSIDVRAVSGSVLDDSPISYEWRVDKTPPITLLAGNTTDKGRKANFHFISEPGSRFDCRLDAGPWFECSSPQMYDEVGEGLHVFYVRAVDAVGNIEIFPSAYSWEAEIDTPPVDEEENHDPEPIEEDPVDPPPPQNSSGLAAIWHFDECEGQSSRDFVKNEPYVMRSNWIVGQQGCAIQQNWYEPHLRWNFPEPIVAFDLTLSFFVRDLNLSSDGSIWILDTDGNYRAGFSPRQGRTMAPHNGREITFGTHMPASTDWQHVAIVYSSESLTWYVDGVEMKKIEGDFHIENPLTTLFIGQSNGPWQIDEIAIWNKALSLTEINTIRSVQISPHLMRPLQTSARLIHHWNFDETLVYNDSVGQSSIVYQYYLPGWSNGGVYVAWDGDHRIEAPLPDITSKDLSLTFWRKNGPSGVGNGTVLIMNKDTREGFGAGGDYQRSHYYLSGADVDLGSYIPNDTEWHHIALVYDSYRYEIKYYVDGILKITRPDIWPHLPINRLVIYEGRGSISIDELGIWEGSLSQEEVYNLAHIEPSL